MQFQISEFYPTHMVWSNNGASPWTHEYIITIIHAIADCAISNAFLTSLKFFKESEVPGNCNQWTKINEPQLLKCLQVVLSVFVLIYFIVKKLWQRSRLWE